MPKNTCLDSEQSTVRLIINALNTVYERYINYTVRLIINALNTVYERYINLQVHNIPLLSD